MKISNYTTNTITVQMSGDVWYLPAGESTDVYVPVTVVHSSGAISVSPTGMTGDHAIIAAAGVLRDAGWDWYATGVLVFCAVVSTWLLFRMLRWMRSLGGIHLSDD